jgi:predicted dithiol-disulfide oxidoreductase (DUF899 family)
MRGEPFNELMEYAQRRHWRIEYLSVDEGRLDDVFRSLTLPENNKIAVAA